MEYKITNKNEIKIAGIALRTTNENGQAAREIPKFWEKFYSQKTQDKIPNKIDSEILGLYTDYSNDYTKPYTFILGCKVNSFDNIPKDLITKIIPASRYAEFTVTGKFPNSLVKAWQYIWNSDLNRTYSGDFEVYGENFFKNINKPTMNIYIAIE